MSTELQKTGRRSEASLSPSSSGGKDEGASCAGEDNEERTKETISQSLHEHSIPSGLSALIQAATSQLGDLIDYEYNKHRSGGGSLPQRPNEQQPHEHNGAAESDEGASYVGPQHNCLPSYSDNIHDNSDINTQDAKKKGDRHVNNNSSSANTTPSMLPEQSPDASKAQDFPNKLMSLALDPNNEDAIAFLPDGKYFAIRAKKFESEVMPQRTFDCSTWQEFLSLLHDWGFSRIFHEGDDNVATTGTTTVVDTTTAASNDETTDINATSDQQMTLNTVEVFRHPKFIKGDWMLCGEIRYGESPTDARLSALPERSIFEYAAAAAVATTTTATTEDVSPSSSSPSIPPACSTSSGSSSGQATISKRRLSPPTATATARRRNSDFTLTRSASHHTQKKRLSWDGSFSRVSLDFPFCTTRKGEDMDLHQSNYRSDAIRSVALALTSEKLHLQSRTSQGESLANNVATVGDSSSSSTSINTKSPPAATALVDQAVQSATHTIVTDAIETLLQDESHTKETYLKHSRELSRSSLPGVVPISKQLFEQQQLQQVERTTTTGGFSSTQGIISTSEDAASAIVAAAIAVEQRAHETSMAFSGTK